MLASEKKKILRLSLLGKRLKLSPVDVKSYSEKILNMLIQDTDLNRVTKIFVYSPIKTRNEVDTENFIKLIQSDYPDIDLTLAPNNLSQSRKIPEGQQHDLVIVPVVGFDRRGFRLGYGGGYYDKFLARNHCKETIGLAYSFSEVERIPDEPHDKKLNKVITEREIIAASD